MTRDPLDASCLLQLSRLRVHAASAAESRRIAAELAVMPRFRGHFNADGKPAGWALWPDMDAAMLEASRRFADVVLEVEATMPDHAWSTRYSNGAVLGNRLQGEPWPPHAAGVPP